MYEIILTNEWEYNVLSLILTQEGLLDVCWWNTCMWFAFCFVVKAENSKLLNMIFIEMMVHANGKKNCLNLWRSKVISMTSKLIKKLGPSIETKTGNPWFTILLSLLIKIWQVLVINISFVNFLNT